MPVVGKLAVNEDFFLRYYEYVKRCSRCSLLHSVIPASTSVLARADILLVSPGSDAWKMLLELYPPRLSLIASSAWLDPNDLQAPNNNCMADTRVNGRRFLGHRLLSNVGCGMNAITCI